MAKRMSNGLVKIYEIETGIAIEVYPIDAADHVKGGLYSYNVPKSKQSVKEVSFENQDEVGEPDIGTVDLELLGRSELLEYAEKTFGEELNTRYGEARLRTEISKLIEQHKNHVDDDNDEETDLDGD